MKYFRLTAFVLALILVLGLCAPTSAEGTYAPDFTVVDGSGHEIKLSDKLDGKPLIFNIWASWCPPCVSELPHFDEAAKLYEGQITFMMVNLTDGGYETVEGAKAFIKSKGYSFPVYYDTFGEVSGIYLGQYIPMTWFINADGTILGYIEGGMEKDTLLNCISQLLEG